MKDVQCYELFGGIALKNHVFSFSFFFHIYNVTFMKSKVKSLYKLIIKKLTVNLSSWLTFFGFLVGMASNSYHKQVDY